MAKKKKQQKIKTKQKKTLGTGELLEARSVWKNAESRESKKMIP